MSETENTMGYDDIEEIDLDDFIDALANNIKKDTKDFNDLVNLESYLNREVILSDIVDGTGNAISGYIDFWNRWDEKHDIPVEKREPVKIYIHSYGGNLVDTLQIIDSIKLSKTPVWTIATGAAYSGGFFTLIAGHKRLAYPHASFLYHEGATSSSGTAGQFDNYAAFYKRQLKQLKDHVLEHTKITNEKYDEIHKDDWWLDTTEALEYGVIDAIVTDREQLKGNN